MLEGVLRGFRQRRRAAIVGALGLCLLLAGEARADLVAEPPQTHGVALAPVPLADWSGAEPLMQQALTAARAELNVLLAEPAPDAATIAAAYGRLGALLILVEVEAQADACLANAMAFQPEELRWPYYAGYLAMLAGNLEAAVGHLERARDIAPDYAPLYVRLGKVHLDRSALAEAEAALTRAAAEPSLAAPANYYRGQIAVLQRRFADAIGLLDAALAANPGATEVHYPLAQAHRALGNTEAARAHLAQFRLREPAIADLLIDELRAATDHALPAFKEALHAVRGGDYDTAVRRFADGLAVAPDNADARISYARVLWLTGQQSAAESALAQVLAAAPDATFAVFLDGVVAQARGDVDAAAARYAQVLAQAPEHAGALFALANLDFHAGRHAAAAAGYERVLAADAGVAPARVLAQVAALRGGAAEADVLATVRGLAERHPDDPQLRYALARLLAAAEDASLREPAAARNLAAALLADPAAGGPIPPHQRALALARAAGGDMAGAKALLQPLADAAWMLPPAEAALVEAELAAYADGRLPQPWPDGDLLLAPPPFSADQLMRDYPATKPY
ncbi:tetratricopeptide repeat protein [Thiohalocapsa sp. ML1]|uniref:tetratricopeptide repeat protein n=1 Tax=Thiohalocapsa sp. ML1 TaxID=1431688 RepID=UPI0012E3FA32|nr:tetratricopeptide repeat protein [Thiohalocapsa sp. ML1]